MTVQVRPITRADLSDFHHVMMSAGMDARSSWSRTTTADLERSLFADGAGGFVAVQNGSGQDRGEVVGCVGYRPDGTGTLTLNKLATLPEVRGQGVGRLLVQAVEETARQNGFGRVLLAVSQFNLEVIPYYAKLGYAKSDGVYSFANPASPAPVVMVKEVRSGSRQG